MTSGFLTKTFVFDPRPSYPLLSAVKRYWKENSPHLDDTNALTLILIHVVGFHKELSEPCIGELQSILDRKLDTSNVKIREIWSIDLPNHGDSAVLNKRILKLGYEDTCRFTNSNLSELHDISSIFARSLGRTREKYLSGLGSGVDSFYNHKLVGIGHSIGETIL